MNTLRIPETYLSIHSITGLRAAALVSADTPLMLQIDSEHGPMQISLYFESWDKDRVERLADAINAIMSEKEPARAPCPVEKAAYASQEEYWTALKRDLDRATIGTRR